MAHHLPSNFEDVQTQLLQFTSSLHSSWRFETPETDRAKSMYKAAFCAYTQWCINMVDKHPHTEGPIMTRRLLGWTTVPDNTTYQPVQFVDERFFASIDPSLAKCYSLILLNRSWTPSTEVRSDMVPDAIVESPLLIKKTSSESKKHLSQIKRYSHAKPCSQIKDLATHHRSAGSKGYPVKALHSGTCGVCNLYRDCGNKQGRLPASIYRAVVMAHLGPSNKLSQLCQRIKDRQKHPDPPDPQLPSLTIDRVPKRKIENQSSPQVAKFPREPEVRRRKKSKPFEMIDGVYTFVGTDENMESLSRQDLSGHF
jgi:hypothetical protein